MSIMSILADTVYVHDSAGSGGIGLIVLILIIVLLVRGF
jgi:hypothetical protein